MGIPLIYSVLRTEWDTKIINATRMSVARCGWTQRNITIGLQPIARVPSGVPSSKGRLNLRAHYYI